MFSILRAIHSIETLKCTHIAIKANKKHFDTLPIFHILSTLQKYKETVHQLFVHFKKTCDSVRREVLYNFLIEIGVLMKLVRLIKMCLNDTYSKVRIGKHLSDSFPIQNGLKQGDAFSPQLFNFA
jgi:hypothetical protein